MPQTKVLNVPYFMQPTPITCQSTCLRMFAMYLEHNVVLQSTGAGDTGAGDRDISAIWKDINEAPNRPSPARNAHANMKWWLERRFPKLAFEYHTVTDEIRATQKIINFINAGKPVLMSVSHARVPGHIVLVIGYENYVPRMTGMDFNLVVHDPYGKFDPSLLSPAYGGKRHMGGMSLLAGGETGPGQNCRLPVANVSRQRAGDKNRGTYYLLSAR